LCDTCMILIIVQVFPRDRDKCCRDPASYWYFCLMSLDWGPPPLLTNVLGNVVFPVAHLAPPIPAGLTNTVLFGVAGRSCGWSTFVARQPARGFLSLRIPLVLHTFQHVSTAPKVSVRTFLKIFPFFAWGVPRGGPTPPL